MKVHDCASGGNLEIARPVLSPPVPHQQLRAMRTACFSQRPSRVVRGPDSHPRSPEFPREGWYGDQGADSRKGRAPEMFSRAAHTSVAQGAGVSRSPASCTGPPGRTFTNAGWAVLVYMVTSAPCPSGLNWAEVPQVPLM